MGRNLESRLRKLEEQLRVSNDMRTLLLDAFSRNKSDGFRFAVDSMLEQIGSEQCLFSSQSLTARDRGIASLLFLGMNDDDSFAIEEFRDLVPSKVIAAVYSKERNYAYSAEITSRVRRLAGVCDANGSPLPGYVLHSNGSIIDAQEQTVCVT